LQISSNTSWEQHYSQWEKFRKVQWIEFRIASLLPDAYSLTATPKNGFLAPLVVQDQTIGYLSVKTPGDRDLTEDEWALLQAVAQQLAQKVENLPLIEATQQRTSREQISRRIIS
jgi:GAF domain-containing protein